MFCQLGSKITADGDCSREIKRLLLLGRKAMTNLDSILKSRDITLLFNILSRLVIALLPRSKHLLISGPITSLQIEGEKVEVVTDFLFLGSEITVDGASSHEIRR